MNVRLLDVQSGFWSAGAWLMKSSGGRWPSDVARGQQPSPSIHFIGWLIPLCLAVITMAVVGCSDTQAVKSTQNTKVDAATEQEVIANFVGYADTIAVARSAGYDYLAVVRRCLLRDKPAMHDLFRMSKDASFDGASSEGHAGVLGHVLRDAGDRFFGTCLEQMAPAVQQEVREHLLFDLGYGENALTADEIRRLYPKTFPSSFPF